MSSQQTLLNIHFKGGQVLLEQRREAKNRVQLPMNIHVKQPNQGKARTQSPTTRNYAVAIPTFGEFAKVSTAGVQWLSLALSGPPS